MLTQVTNTATKNFAGLAWAGYCVLGIVILALFLMLFFVLRSAAAERRETFEANLQNANRRDDKLTGVISNLTGAIRELEKKNKSLIAVSIQEQTTIGSVGTGGGDAVIGNRKKNETKNEFNDKVETANVAEQIGNRTKEEND